MTFEIILPALPMQHWFASFVFLCFGIFLSVGSWAFLADRTSDTDIITGIILGFFAILLFFATLVLWQIITVVFV